MKTKNLWIVLTLVFLFSTSIFALDLTDWRTGLPSESDEAGKVALPSSGVDWFAYSTPENIEVGRATCTSNCIYSKLYHFKVKRLLGQNEYWLDAPGPLLLPNVDANKVSDSAIMVYRYDSTSLGILTLQQSTDPKNWEFTTHKIAPDSVRIQFISLYTLDSVSGKQLGRKLIAGGTHGFLVFIQVDPETKEVQVTKIEAPNLSFSAFLPRVTQSGQRRLQFGTQEGFITDLDLATGAWNASPPKIEFPIAKLLENQSLIDSTSQLPCVAFSKRGSVWLSGLKISSGYIFGTSDFFEAGQSINHWIALRNTRGFVYRKFFGNFFATRSRRTGLVSIDSRLLPLSDTSILLPKTSGVWELKWNDHDPINIPPEISFHGQNMLGGDALTVDDGVCNDERESCPYIDEVNGEFRSSYRILWNDKSVQILYNTIASPLDTKPGDLWKISKSSSFSLVSLKPYSWKEGDSLVIKSEINSLTLWHPATTRVSRDQINVNRKNLEVRSNHRYQDKSILGLQLWLGRRLINTNR